MIRIEDNGEPLVDLKKTCPGVVVKWSRKTLPWEKTAFLRKTVAEKLNQAKNYLPEGVTFVIGDAWRPVELQRQIFKEYIKRFQRLYSSWSQEEVISESKKFVAPWQGKDASGHLTGGAVDLRLWKNGRKLPMKSRQLSFQENALPVQPKLSAYIQNNRQIMFTVLRKVGFSNASREWWHWSYGDYWWARRTGRKMAFYGVVKKPF